MKSSILDAGWRYQLMVAFALMTIIPLLTFGYFLSAYLLPHTITRENLLLIVGLNFILAGTGLVLLQRFFRSFLRFREYIKTVALGDLSQPFPVSEGIEFVEMAGALQRIVRTLRNDRDQLLELTKRLEQEVTERTNELRDTNTRLSDALTRMTRMQEELIRKDQQMAACVPAGGTSAVSDGVVKELHDLLAELRQHRPKSG